MSITATFDGHLKIATSGVRIAPPLDLSAIAQATSGKVHIIANTSPGASIIVKLAVAETEPGVEDYAEVFNGDPMPGIDRGESLDGKKLYAIQELSTEDTAQLPVIEMIVESIGEQQECTAISYVSPVITAASRKGTGTRTAISHVAPIMTQARRAGWGARTAVSYVKPVASGASRIGRGVRLAVSYVRAIISRMVLPQVNVHVSHDERAVSLSVQQREVKLEVEE